MNLHIKLVVIFLLSCLLPLVIASNERTIPANEASNLVKRAPSSTWWFANIYRNGTVPFRDDINFTFFRNVKDFGALGDGIADDSTAINAAMSAPGDCGRCIGQYNPVCPCESSTITTAMVYFPPGIYRIKNEIILPYNTLAIGDALNPPTILGDPTFNGLGLFNADPYYPGGASWYINQNNFFRQVRNFIFDITELPIDNGKCIHWQVAQATSLQNLVFNMRQGGGSSNKQQGIFMENGSGGFMRDLIFNGGGIAFFLGNQQFTSTNLTFNNCVTAIRTNFIWTWLFRDMTFKNCHVGIDMYQESGYGTNSQPLGAIGSITLTDSSFINVDIGIISQFSCSFIPPSVNNIVIDSVDFNGAEKAITYQNGTVILPGGQYVDGWVQGPVYHTDYQTQVFPDHNNDVCWVPQGQGACKIGFYNFPSRPSGLFDTDTEMWFDRGKPSYNNFTVDQFKSIKAFGCSGDGVTDDSICLQNFLNSLTWEIVGYIDHGAYVVTSPIFIPKNIRLIGEGWPLIMIKSSPIWNDQHNPEVAFTVANKGDVGHLEVQDIIFETMGPTPGAILMEWNLEEDAQGSAGMWDVHWRIGGTAGTQLEMPGCAKDPGNPIIHPNPACYASFLLLHITETASLYMENNWGWIADHELDVLPRDQINIWQGRGVLIESIKPVWVIGSSFEHAQLYNYGVHNAKNLYMGHIQSETAYMQSNPPADVAFPPNATWQDPDFAICMGARNCTKTYGLHIWNSSYVYIYNPGLYSFFENYSTETCLANVNCQMNQVSVEQSGYIYLYSYYSIGARNLVLMDNQQIIPYNKSLTNSTFGQAVAIWGFPESGEVTPSLSG